MPANTYGRQVVEALTNKSGGSVAAGDVVVIDTTNNDAFTTSTAGSFVGFVGVAQETIANNATGRVATAGYVALVNVNASVTRGNFGKTHTVAKQATDGGSTRAVGTFCQFLTGGTTPDAHLFGFPDNTSGAGSGTVTTVKDEGSNLSTAVVSLDFVGAGVTATGTTAVTVTIPYDLWRVEINPLVGMTVNTGFAIGNISTDQWGTWGNNSSNQNDELGCDVVLTAGTWTFYVMGYRFTSRGIATLSLDGSSVGTVDFYGTALANYIGSAGSISVATTGKKAFKLKMATKNASSSGYGMWLSWITLVRTA